MEQMKFKEAFALNWRAFLFLYNRDKKPFISSACYHICKAISPYAGIFFSARIIGELAGNRDVSELTKWILLTLIATAMLTALTHIAKKYYTVYFQNLRWFNYEDTYAEKFLNMDFCVLEDSKTFDLRSQIDRNNRMQGWGLNHILYTFECIIPSVTSILSAIALSVSLFTQKVPESATDYTFLNHPLFVVVAITVLLALTLLAPFTKSKGYAYFGKWAEESGQHGNNLVGYWGFSLADKKKALDMRIYRQDKIAAYFNKDTATYFSDSTLTKYQRGPMGILFGCSMAITALLSGVIYLFVCAKAWAGAFGIGYVTQYVGAITALTGGINELLNCLSEIGTNAIYLKTTFEFLDLPNPMYQGSLTTEKRADRQYEVEFKDVSFKYPGTDTWALRHVNMKFKVGSRLAVVGMNGSGKTTFIKLLCRLYDPTEGQILLNGIDIRKYRYDDYIDIFSVVFQDFKLLALPLGENVAGAAKYDKERVLKCLKDAGFDERMESMPNGLETYLYKDLDKEGVEVSGGEAQKIAIARALYKDAPFIILDEPTAALDPIAEAEIYSKFNDIAGDKTAIYISHRLSSCRFCDDILVFHEGNVIQQGCHESLVADIEGKYFELWNAQAQYYV